MVLLLKVKQMFQNAVMIIRLKYFHDSLNIVVILPSSRDFFSLQNVPNFLKHLCNEIK